MLSGQGGPARVGTRVHFVNSVGHEMVSLVPPAPRRGIYSGNAQRFLHFPPTAVGVPFLKFRLNFIFLRREGRSALAS